MSRVLHPNQALHRTGRAGRFRFQSLVRGLPLKGVVGPLAGQASFVSLRIYLSTYNSGVQLKMTASTDPAPQNPQDKRPYRVINLNYVSLYLNTLSEAVTFYSRVFGPPESVDQKQDIFGWRMGSTWLTLLPSKAGLEPDSNPRSTEFAVQVSAVVEVDHLYQALIAAGAKACMPPADTVMYEPMRFCCVDDPFGVRIDVYCPTAGG